MLHMAESNENLKNETKRKRVGLAQTNYTALLEEDS